MGSGDGAKRSPGVEGRGGGGENAAEHAKSGCNQLAGSTSIGPGVCIQPSRRQEEGREGAASTIGVEEGEPAFPPPSSATAFSSSLLPETLNSKLDLNMLSVEVAEHDLEGKAGFVGHAMRSVMPVFSSRSAPHGK